MKYLTLIFTLIPIALLLVGIDVVQAQADPPPRTLIDMSLGGSSTTGRPDIVAYLNSLFAVALGLAAIIAVIKIIIAGVKYMLSDVVTNKASAKDDIKNALLGLIILLAVYLILYTINPNLTNLDIFTRLQQLPDVSAPANSNPTDDTQAVVDDVVDDVVANTENCAERSREERGGIIFITENYTACPGSFEQNRMAFLRYCDRRGGDFRQQTDTNGKKIPKVYVCELDPDDAPGTVTGTIIQGAGSYPVNEIPLNGPEITEARKECETAFGRLSGPLGNSVSRDGKTYFNYRCDYPAVYGYAANSSENRLDCKRNIKGAPTTDNLGRYGNYELLCLKS